MRVKRYIFWSLFVMGFSAIFVFWPRNNVDGIQLFSFNDYFYARKVHSVLDGDAIALLELTETDCDGELCYEQGEVLANILVKMGDGEFAKVVHNLPAKGKVNLHSLLLAGIEYGSFPKYLTPLTLDETFPKTRAELIKR